MNVKSIKKDIIKIMSIKEKIRNIKDSVNKIHLPLFAITYIPLLILFLREFNQSEKSFDSLFPSFIMASVMIFVIFFFGSKILSCSIASRINKKEKEALNKYNSILFKKNAFYKKRDLDEITNLQKELSEETINLNECYFNAEEKNNEELFEKILFFKFIKEKISINKFKEYVAIAKKEMNDDLFLLFLEKIILEVMSTISREEFFNNKNEFINMVINENFSLSIQQKLTKEIKDLVKKYNSNLEEKNKLLEELSLLKNEQDNLRKDHLPIITNSQKILIKNI
jgi:hypothetical protein